MVVDFNLRWLVLNFGPISISGFCSLSYDYHIDYLSTRLLIRLLVVDPVIDYRSGYRSGWLSIWLLIRLLTWLSTGLSTCSWTLIVGLAVFDLSPISHLIILQIISIPHIFNTLTTFSHCIEIHQNMVEYISKVLLFFCVFYFLSHCSFLILLFVLIINVNCIIYSQLLSIIYFAYMYMILYYSLNHSYLSMNLRVYDLQIFIVICLQF